MSAINSNYKQYCCNLDLNHHETLSTYLNGDYLKFDCLFLKDEFIYRLWSKFSDPYLKFSSPSRKTDSLPSDYIQSTSQREYESSSISINQNLLNSYIDNNVFYFESEYHRRMESFLRLTFPRPRMVNKDKTDLDPSQQNDILHKIILYRYWYGHSKTFLFRYLKKRGVHISPTSIKNTIISLTQTFLPFYEFIRIQIRESEYMQIGAQPYLKSIVEDDEKKCMGLCWMFYDPKKRIPFVYYQPNLSLPGFYIVLKCKIQYIQTTNQGFRNVFDELNGRYSIACWNEVKERILITYHSDELRSETLLGFVFKLYQIEQDLHTNNADDQMIIRFRKYDSFEQIRQLEQWILQERNLLSQNHPLVYTLDFVYQRIEELSRYLFKADFKLDTSHADSLFATMESIYKDGFSDKHDYLTQVVFCTLISLCKEHEVDFSKWFQDILMRKAAGEKLDPEKLSPINWSPSLRWSTRFE